MHIRKSTKEEILMVMTHPDIYDCICEDGGPNSDGWNPDDSLYLSGYAENKLIGVVNVHQRGKVLAQAHIQVLPEHRKRYSDLFMRECLNWFFDEYEMRVMVEIPEIYPNVIAFVERHGFKEDGRIPQSYVKNSKICDTVILSRGRNSG
jgi:RimJ/RimL family protein N-acetyltransferase